MKIVRNMARCKLCNTTVESKTVHDFRKCKCGELFVDGGKEYFRRGGDINNIEDLSVTSPEKDDKKMKLKILICGDRNWSDSDMILDEIKDLPKDTIIIHGGCRGADKLADEAARLLGMKRIEHQADWENFGKAAGPIRNIKMLGERPDLVIAFHDDMWSSKGTKNMVKIAKDANVPVKIRSHK